MTARPFLALASAAVILAASCSHPPRVTLPSGAGSPFPAFAAAYAESIAECRIVKTISASLSLSGRAGSKKLSARIDAGFAETGQLRLEGYPKVSFGGKPFFTLVSRAGEATLLLNRDGRVLRGTPPAAIIEALTGVSVDPDQLRALVSGCALGATEPADGRSFDNGWASLDAGGTTVFLRQIDRRWRVAAARRASLTVEYDDFSSGRPSTVRLRTIAAAGAVPADLTLRISQLEIDTPLASAVFGVDVPANAAPITLEELRRAGPLGDRQ